MITSANLTNILKHVYENGVKSQIQQSTHLFQMIGKANHIEAGGTDTAFSVLLSPNLDVISLPDGGTLPAGGQSRTAVASVGMAQHYAVLQLTQPAMQRARNSKVAFESLMDMEMKSIAASISEKFNRDLWGDGSGVLCQVATGGGGAINAGNPITVWRAPDGVLTAADQIGADGTRYLRAGQKIAIGTAAELHSNTYVYAIVASVLSRNTFTLDRNVVIVDADYVVRASEAATLLATEFGRTTADAYSEVQLASTSGQRVVTGLKALCDDGFWTGAAGGGFGGTGVHQIEDAGWYSLLPTSSNYTTLQALTQRLIQEMFTIIDEHGPEGGTSVGWMGCHQSVQNEYVDLLTPDVRYQPTRIQGGWEQLTYSGGGKPVPFFVDRDCTYNALYVGGTNALRIVESLSAGWEMKGGGIVKVLPRQDAFEARWRHYWNTAVFQRRALTKCVNIQVQGLTQ